MRDVNYRVEVWQRPSLEQASSNRKLLSCKSTMLGEVKQKAYQWLGQHGRTASRYFITIEILR